MAKKSVDNGSRDIFEWNKRKALAHLLSMEEHCNELDEKDVPHSWCLVKHYMELTYHHVSEAITNAERLGEDVAPYRSFREKLLDLNVYPQPHITEKDVMSLRTEWRKIIKDPTLTSDCPLCSTDVTQEVLSDLKAEAASPQTHKTKKSGSLDLEVEYTNNQLTTLAAKNKRSKPAFMVVDCGKDVDPSGKAIAAVGDNGKPFIAVCSGGVNAHTLAHEAKHVWDHEDGMCDLRVANCPEDDAEKFALRGLSNYSGLNTHPLGDGSVKNSVSERKATAAKIIGIYGASLAAKAVERYGVPYLDTAFPAPIAGQKASMLAKIALGVGVPALAIWKPGIFKRFDTPVMVFSAHIASQLLDDFLVVKPLSVVRTWTPIPGVSSGAGKVVAF